LTPVETTPTPDAEGMEAHKASGNAVTIRGCPRNCDRPSIVAASRHWDLKVLGRRRDGRA
jgi:hypothetical protein